MVQVSVLNVRIYTAIKRLRRRNERQEECLCVILVTIVVTYAVCNLPRLILNIHETFNLDQITLCKFTDLGTVAKKYLLLLTKIFVPQGGIPVWAILLGYVSHVLLVISSSANFYIYCIIGASLRTQLVTSIAATSGLCCK